MARGRAAPGPEEAQGWAPRSCPRLQTERSSQSWGHLNSHLRNTNTVRQVKAEGVSETSLKWSKEEAYWVQTTHRPLWAERARAARSQAELLQHNRTWNERLNEETAPPSGVCFYENHSLWTYEQHPLPVRIRTPASGLRVAGACQPQSMTLKHTSQHIKTNIQTILPLLSNEHLDSLQLILKICDLNNFIIVAKCHLFYWKNLFVKQDKEKQLPVVLIQIK